MTSASIPGAMRLLELHARALRRLSSNPQLRGAPLAVYILLSSELDAAEFREVKVTAVAAELSLHFRVTAKALRRLAKAGYLEPGPTRERVRSYRLRWPDESSVLPLVHQ